MSLSNPSAVGSSDLVSRVKNILLSPQTEWDRIEAEPATIGGIYSGYVIILAAIAPLAQLIHSLVFGYGALGFTYRPPLIGSLVGAVVGYGVSLVMMYVFALVIDGLATNFGGQKDRLMAFKVAAYSGTAAYLAGAFAALPMLGVLGLLGLYSIYLLYLGLPKLMKAPPQQAVGYTAVVIVVMIVIGVVVGAVTAAVEAPFGMGFGMFRHPAQVGSMSGTVNVPGGSVNLGQLDAAAKQAQLAADTMKAAQAGQPAPAGAVTAVAPDVLKALLPDTLAGYPRTEISAAGGGVAGMNATNASATYAKGDSRISLEVSDMGAMGAMAAMAGAANVESSKETATGYEKVGKVDGRLTTEEYDRQSKHGKYSVLVASRFMVEANGDDVSIDDLKGAVSSIGIGRLEGMAHTG